MRFRKFVERIPERRHVKQVVVDTQMTRHPSCADAAEGRYIVELKCGHVRHFKASQYNRLVAVRYQVGRGRQLMRCPECEKKQ